MSETQHPKEFKEPTILHTAGAGIATGVLAWVIIYSIAEHPPTSIEYIRDMFSEGALPYFFFVVFACILGAFIGNSRKKTFRSLWVGAFIGLFVSAILMLCRIFLFVT